MLGKRLGKQTQDVIQAAKKGEWTRNDDGTATVAGETLGPDEFTLLLDARDGVACQALESNDAIAILDLAIDESLEREGRARDIVRVVQQARREADLDVSDRIHLVLELDADWRDAVAEFRDYIADQTLATELDLEDTADRKGYFVHEAALSGATVRVALKSN